MTSETSKYRHLTTQYCDGDGVDIGAGSDPVVPWAIVVDLPKEQFEKYNGGVNYPTVHLTCPPDKLPFHTGTLDFVYSSHLLEDFEDWMPLLRDWTRVLKIGGYLVILLPDKELWKRSVAAGQPPNCAHRREGSVGELTRLLQFKFDLIHDDLTKCSPGPHGIDYSILFVGRKKML